MEVGVTLGRVGEEAEIEGTHEVVVEDGITLLLGGDWLWCRRGSGEGGVSERGSMSVRVTDMRD